MNANYDLFVQAINEKRIITLCFDSKEKGISTRKCISYDFGPSRKYKDGLDRFHFHDLDSPSGSHNLSILPDQIISIELMDIFFEPGDYVTWKPKWFVIRDWGIYS